MANTVQVHLRKGPGIHIHGAQAVRVRTAGEVTVIFLIEADDEPGVLERRQRGLCGRRRDPDGIRYAGTAEGSAHADGVPGRVEGTVTTVGGATLGGTAGGLRWSQQGGEFTDIKHCKRTATGRHTQPGKLPRQRAVLELLSNVPAQPLRSQFWGWPHVFYVQAVSNEAPRSDQITTHRRRVALAPLEVALAPRHAARVIAARAPVEIAALLRATGGRCRFALAALKEVGAHWRGHVARERPLTVILIAALRRATSAWVRSTLAAHKVLGTIRDAVRQVKSSGAVVEPTALRRPARILGMDC